MERTSVLWMPECVTNYISGSQLFSVTSRKCFGESENILYLMSKNHWHQHPANNSLIIERDQLIWLQLLQVVVTDFIVLSLNTIFKFSVLTQLASFHKDWSVCMMLRTEKVPPPCPQPNRYPTLYLPTALPHVRCVILHLRHGLFCFHELYLNQTRKFCCSLCPLPPSLEFN